MNNLTPKLLGSILYHQDRETYLDIDTQKVQNYFPEPKYEDMYLLMLKIYRISLTPPTHKVLKEYIAKDLQARSLNKTLQEVDKVTKRGTKLLKPQEITSLLDLQKRTNLKELLQDQLLNLTDKLEEAKIEELEDYKEELHNITSHLTQVLENENKKEIFLHNSVSAQEDFQQRYQHNKKSGGTKLCNYGVKQLDDTFKGIRNSDLIFLLGFAKQFKSTLLRNIARNAQKQAKNVLYITMEMPEQEIEASWLSMTCNDKDLYTDSPRITYDEILEAKVPIENEPFMYQVYNDLCSSEDQGVLYILYPNKTNYKFEDFEADVKRVQEKYMQIDLICLDSINLTEEGDMNAVDKFIASTRQFILKEGIPVISPLQIKRSSYIKACEKEGNLYDLDAVRYYSEALTSATRVVATMQTEEMKEIDEVQLQNLLSRDTGLFKPFKMIVDTQVGLMRGLNDLETTLQNDDGTIDDKTMQEIIEATSQKLFDD